MVLCSHGRCMDDVNDFIPMLTLDNDSSMFSRLKACVDHNDDSYDWCPINVFYFLRILLKLHRILALYSHVCLYVCVQAWHFHLSPPYDVLDHTNHIFSESLSSGDDIGRDEDLQKDKYKDKDTQTQTKTNTKCFQDPMYAIFIKSRGFKDLKYYIGCLLVMTQTKTKIQFLHY